MRKVQFNCHLEETIVKNPLENKMKEILELIFNTLFLVLMAVIHHFSYMAIWLAINKREVHCAVGWSDLLLSANSENRPPKKGTLKVT